MSPQEAQVNLNKLQADFDRLENEFHAECNRLRRIINGDNLNDAFFQQQQEQERRRWEQIAAGTDPLSVWQKNAMEESRRAAEFDQAMAERNKAAKEAYQQNQLETLRQMGLQVR